MRVFVEWDIDCFFIGTGKYQARVLAVHAELARPVRGPWACYFPAPMKTNSQYPVCYVIPAERSSLNINMILEVDVM